MLNCNGIPRVTGSSDIAETNSAGPSTISSTLISRVRQHDALAWQQLSRQFGPLVYRWARRAGLQETDASDVVQEAFRGIATGIATFSREQSGQSFRGWLWTITRNKLADHFRKLGTSPQATGGTDAHQQWEQMPQPPAALESETERSRSRAALLQQILEIVETEFEPQTRQAFQRFAVDGLPAAQVAEELGMTSKAVRQAKYRVLLRLRAEMNELWD